MFEISLDCFHIFNFIPKLLNFLNYYRNIEDVKIESSIEIDINFENNSLTEYLVYFCR